MWRRDLQEGAPDVRASAGETLEIVKGITAQGPRRSNFADYEVAALIKGIYLVADKDAQNNSISMRIHNFRDVRTRYEKLVALARQ